MSTRPSLAAAAGLALLLMTSLPLAGCKSSDGPTVVQIDPSSETTTATLSPLQKGEIRRTVLESVQSGIDAWIASDTETMRTHFNDTVMTPFEQTWADYDARGLTIVHEHEPVYFDVIDLNNTGAQALVKYRYNDTSYLIDSNGTRTDELEALSENEIQFTVEKQSDGGWLAVRVIGASLR